MSDPALEPTTEQADACGGAPPTDPQKDKEVSREPSGSSELTSTTEPATIESASSVTIDVAAYRERAQSEYKQFGLMDFEHLEKTVAASKNQEWLIEDFIYKKSVTMFCGHWGIGKSPLVLQMLLRTASGSAFLNHGVPQPLRVLYADFENSGTRVKETIERLKCALQLSQAPLFNLSIWSPNYSPTTANSVLPPVRQLELMLQVGSFDLLVIDPLRGFWPDAESKNEIALKMIGTLRGWAAKYGTTTIIVHHPRKESSNSDASSDSRYSLEDDPDRWMQQVSGAGALVSNTDIRIGFDKSSTSEELLFRVFLKGQGWRPTQYLTRIVDDEGEPLCYGLVNGLGRLTPDERKAYEQLPQDFETKDLKKIRLAQNAGASNGTVGELLKNWEAWGLIRKLKRGRWRRLS